ncbi:Blm [Bacillus pseudomycoides]|nr:Blm [Bacillus pseudomycoides]EEM10835.1 Blm [Bacillus pseudomycoides]
MKMKKKLILKVGLCASILGISQFASSIFPVQAAEKVEQIKNKDQEKDVSISQLYPKVWMHTSIGVVNGTRIPANGLILETSKGLVLIDTPWNDDLTDQLLQILKKQFPTKEVTEAIVTHAHDDRIGGIKTLTKKGVKVHSTALTADLAEKQGFDKPLGDLKKRDNMRFGDINVETFYPGKGHTQDNITVWLPKYKILFGGCLIKSLDTQEIVQTPGSYVSNWSKAIKKVEKKYSDINIIVPGHGDPGDSRLFTHTLNLLKNNEN